MLFIQIFLSFSNFNQLRPVISMLMEVGFKLHLVSETTRPEALNVFSDPTDDGCTAKISKAIRYNTGNSICFACHQCKISQSFVDVVVGIEVNSGGWFKYYSASVVDTNTSFLFSILNRTALHKSISSSIWVKLLFVEGLKLLDSC